ncbi:GGDEF domain-containing protein, partial [Clostridiaceae bacterium HSG29]|nr:GGDEF domain-containing protein [Clostridiaceae bacterium HSG29]
IYIVLIIFNYILLKNENKNFKIFYLLYFISTFSMLYGEFNYEMLISLIIFKLLLIYAFINTTIKEHNTEIKEIRKKSDKLEKSFEKSVRFEAQKRTMSLERINSRALEKSKTDKLTSTLNKEGIMNKIDSFILDKRVRTFSLLFFDIDKFKDINDTYGHNIGDKALKSLADSVFDIKRDEDCFGRYGGDEFIILLKNTTTTDANMVANRYREHVKKNSKPKFTISIGFSTFPNDGVTVKSLLEIADNGLYASKERGRDRVSYTGMNKILN